MDSGKKEQVCQELQAQFSKIINCISCVANLYGIRKKTFFAADFLLTQSSGFRALKASSDGSVLPFLTAKQKVPGSIPGAGQQKRRGKLLEETRAGQVAPESPSLEGNRVTRT